VVVTVVRIARPPVRAGASRVLLLLLTTTVVIAGVLTVVWLLTARPMR
jgi:hypothetical protein